jgi:hypothetical protein
VARATPAGPEAGMRRGSHPRRTNFGRCLPSGSRGLRHGRNRGRPQCQMTLSMVLHWLVRRTGVPVARISALGPTPHRDRHGRGRRVCHVWSCATRIDKRRLAAIEPAVEQRSRPPRSEHWRRRQRRPSLPKVWSKPIHRRTTLALAQSHSVTVGTIPRYLHAACTVRWARPVRLTRPALASLIPLLHAAASPMAEAPARARN